MAAAKKETVKKETPAMNKGDLTCIMAALLTAQGNSSILNALEKAEWVINKVRSEA